MQGTGSIPRAPCTKHPVLCALYYEKRGLILNKFFRIMRAPTPSRRPSSTTQQRGMRVRTLELFALAQHIKSKCVERRLYGSVDHHAGASGCNIAEHPHTEGFREHHRVWPNIKHNKRTIAGTYERGSAKQQDGGSAGQSHRPRGACGDCRGPGPARRQASAQTSWHAAEKPRGSPWVASALRLRRPPY